MEIPEINLRTVHADGSVTAKGGRLILEPWEVPDKPKAGLPDTEETRLIATGWVDVTATEMLGRSAKELAYTAEDIIKQLDGS